MISGTSSDKASWVSNASHAFYICVEFFTRSKEIYDDEDDYRKNLTYFGIVVYSTPKKQASTRVRSPVAKSSKRRLVAIMFTDIVGYTTLNQSDERRALQILEIHNRLLRSIFRNYHGKEVKTIGDAFLLEFDSALDATNCAVEIQKSLHDYNESAPENWKIKLRIGIHLGDVVHKGKDILGDAVNIAARIQPLSDPEGICISEQVYDQVHNKTAYPLELLEKADLKNVTFKTGIYSVRLPWQEGRLAITQIYERKLDRLRLAVLPLSSMSSDPRDEYFSDGMTEELISTISNISGLSVISRTSAMQYKNAPKKMIEIGTELNAGSVLEGSVRKWGSRVRIAVQLIDVGDDRHVWSQSYDRELQDVFAIQSDIARKVAQSLEIQLLSTENERIEKAKTENTEAHILYLKGRYFWNERSVKSLKKALEYFRFATEKDPGFALAYSGIADCYTVLADFGAVSPDEALSNSTSASLKALEIDRGLAEAHASYANSLENQWKFDAAEREFISAITLNPNYATAHQWYGLHLERVRRFDEAFYEIEKARNLDPLSLQIRNNVALLHVSRGEYSEAVAGLRSILESDPDFGPAHLWLIIALAFGGFFKESIEEIHQEFAGKGGLGARPMRVGMCAVAYAKAGMRKDANEVIEQLRKRSEKEFVDPVIFASIYSALEMKEEAFWWLERGYEMHSSLMIYLQVYPWFESLKSDGRYKVIINRIGLGVGVPKSHTSSESKPNNNLPVK